MAKELENCGLPTVQVTALPTISAAMGVPRYLTGVAIAHPLGNPALGAEHERILRHRLVEQALALLTLTPAAAAPVGPASVPTTAVMQVQAPPVQAQPDLALDLCIHPVRDLQFAPTTRLAAATLYLDAAELRRELRQDDRLQDCLVEIMRPGEPVRAIHVIDVVEPRVKAATGDYFAGLIGTLAPLGRGRTHVLRGAAVVVSCALPAAEEGIIDMTGPAAAIGKFSQTCNLVVVPVLRAGLSAADANRAALECGLRAAVYLGRAALDQEPATVESYRWDPPAPGVPRVAYIYYLYSHGQGREKFLYGQSTRDILPTIVHPNEILDGAIAQCGPTMPSKSVTCNHVSNGVLRTLYPRHNAEVALAGVIVVNHPLTLADKQRSAAQAARLARYVLQSTAVIVTKDGGGQADVDLAECCDHCHELGMTTVVLIKEDGGAGTYPLAVVSRWADAMVSTGNGGEAITLGARIERVIGGKTLYDGTPSDQGDLSVPYNTVVGAVDFQGDVRVATREL